MNFHVDHSVMFETVYRTYMWHACCHGYTMQAQDDDRNGFPESAKSKASVSLGLNIAAVVVTVLIWILIIIGIISVPVAATVSRL